MKGLIRSVLETSAPGLLGRLRSYRMNRHESRRREQLERVLDAITSERGYVVQSGPFEGMKYLRRIQWVPLPPKLLGVYERELEATTRTLMSRNYDVLVNIGSAEGYYAVGFARACPKTRVIAYDVDPQSQADCAELARLNGVSARVQVRGECTHSSLDADIQGNTLVISDCEGCEEVLLDPAKCAKLARADMLVELHEFVSSGSTERVLSRFRGTHSIEILDAVAAGPEVAGNLPLDEADRLFAVTEFRPPGMQWALMTTTRQPRSD